MDFISLASKLILGYETLPQNIRSAFEATDAGNELIQAVQQLEQNLTRAENKGIFTQLYRMMSTVPDTSSREEYIESAQAYLQYNLRSSKEYRDLVQHIHKIKLKSILQEWALKHVEHLHVDLLQTTTQHHIQVMNLDQFNAEHAKTLAKKTVTIDEWVERYEASLQDHIKLNISLINGQKPFPNPPVFSKKYARESLSSLYSYLLKVRNNQKEVKWCADSINKVADAHAFLQATGFATQNETSWLAWFDIVNYFRMAGHIADAKSILSKFTQPFTPLFIEYSKINREQNIVNQIIRTVMPMLILSAAVILVSALLSSFVIPEIAFIFILLPTIYLGLIAASFYVVAKDFIYNGLCQHWYGGQFKIPEYQVSERMKASFGSAEKALKVRDFYVDEISTCFENEKEYQKQARLSQAEKENREKNTERNRELQLEWYDIHSNPNLSTDATMTITLNRLDIEGRKTCNDLQSALGNELKNEIPAVIHKITDKIRTSVDQTRPLNTEQPRFFTRPACFKYREEVERLNTLRVELGM